MDGVFSMSKYLTTERGVWSPLKGVCDPFHHTYTHWCVICSETLTHIISLCCRVRWRELIALFCKYNLEVHLSMYFVQCRICWFATDNNGIILHLTCDFLLCSAANISSRSSFYSQFHFQRNVTWVWVMEKHFHKKCLKSKYHNYKIVVLLIHNLNFYMIDDFTWWFYMIEYWTFMWLNIKQFLDFTLQIVQLSWKTIMC